MNWQRSAIILIGGFSLIDYLIHIQLMMLDSDCRMLSIAKGSKAFSVQLHLPIKSLVQFPLNRKTMYIVSIQISDIFCSQISGLRG